MALSFVCVCVLFCAGAFQDLGGVGREAFPMGERPEGGTRPTQQRGETIETKPVTKPVCTTRPCFSVLACTVLVQYLYSTCTVQVQYLYSTCTVLVQYLYSTCTVLVQYLYSTCTVLVQLVLHGLRMPSGLPVY